jgi:hypothetical protein
MICLDQGYNKNLRKLQIVKYIQKYEGYKLY